MADPDKPGDTPNPAGKDDGEAVAPVKKKRATRKTTATKAAGSKATSKKATAKKKTTTRKAASKKTASKKTAARKTVASAAGTLAPNAVGVAKPATISTAARASGPMPVKAAEDWTSLLVLWAPLLLIGLLVLLFVGDEPSSRPGSGSAAPSADTMQSALNVPSSPLTPVAPTGLVDPATLAPAEALSKAFEEAAVSSPATLAPAAASGDSGDVEAGAAIPPPPPRAGAAPPPALPGAVPQNPWAPLAQDYNVSPSGGSLWPAQPPAPAPAWDAPAGQLQ